MFIFDWAKILPEHDSDMILRCGKYKSMLNISLILDMNYTELRSYFWKKVAEDELLALRVVNSIRIVIERLMFERLGSLLVSGVKGKNGVGVSIGYCKMVRR